MDLHDSSVTEQAVLAVLTGTPLAEAADWAHTFPGHLAEAAARYRAAGRMALATRPDPSGWHQVNIEFADYPTAELTFFTYLLPPLREATDTGMVGSWWFVRKYPCWRLRVTPGREATDEELSEHLAGVLNSAVSWGVVKRWRSVLYEPKTMAFGGPEGIEIAHDLFHIDSVGALDYLHRTSTAADGTLDAMTTSLLVISHFLRAADQGWSDQGDVWARVEEKRPLPEDVTADRVAAMTGTLHELLTMDTGLVDTNTGQLAAYADWAAGMQRGGQAIALAANAGLLGVGTRGILARHILCQWNRMGFTPRQQGIWARAARETILGA
ncbi:thiopeptide-type bacteriocin biosynthesis protein [Streptomyces sp. NK08204]|uniref:thiopeptide-type bacteriocin biosynthesis protein n=1 Tax=Streptomyces sp. NK08204 TaxID=2873260 RepID=UPI001CECB2FA|nr:thiopeptide-type bacteriocin biosynthesis protein [Streptomyces sp. NK08204]